MAEREWGFYFRMVDPDDEVDANTTVDPDWYRWVSVIPPQDPEKPGGWLLPYGMQIRVAVDRSRRLVCTGLRLGGQPLQGDADGTETEITATSLRDIRLTEILADLRERLDMPDWLLADLGISAAIATRAPEPVDRRPVGRRGHPPEFYQEVAALYHEAGAVKPVKRIAEHYVVAQATAHGYVRRARQLGFLGRAIPGKAGELVPVNSELTVTYDVKGRVDSAAKKADDAASPRETDHRKEQS